MGNVLKGKNICHDIKKHILEKNMNVKTVGNASAVNMCYGDIEEHIIMGEKPFECEVSCITSVTDVIQLTLTLKMTTTQVVETSVTANNSPIQNYYVHVDDHAQPTYEMTPGFKPFAKLLMSTAF